MINDKWKSKSKRELKYKFIVKLKSGKRGKKNEFEFRNLNGKKKPWLWWQMLLFIKDTCQSYKQLGHFGIFNNPFHS
jgi:hypothetical protein